jgi:lipopolysaccharide/colanic/teichoic acid biosynthesis glycosyltransferase
MLRPTLQVFGMPMMSPYTQRIEERLLIADLCTLLGCCVVSWHLHGRLSTSLVWVMGIAWFAGLKLVGGQTPSYLTPRYRIFVCMCLALSVAALTGVMWTGSGYLFYYKHGVLFLLVLGLVGIFTRFVVAFFYQRVGIQLVPFRITPSYRPLLDELALHPHVSMGRAVRDTQEALAARSARIPMCRCITDLRMSDSDSRELFPFFRHMETTDLFMMYENLLGKVAMVHNGEQWVLPRALHKISPAREGFKRIFDTVFVLITAPVTLTLVALSALAIKLTSPGPVFFTQERLGKFGNRIRIIKLRTMVTDAERNGRQWAKGSDHRVTPIGRILRATGIDEIPQFVNILRGEMSLIGPRPECPEIAESLEQQIPFYQMRLLLLPGLTGWAQLHQGGDATRADVSNKLRYDLYYLKYGSPLLDVQIFLGTIQMLLHLAKPKPNPIIQSSTPSIEMTTGEKVTI